MTLRKNPLRVRRSHHRNLELFNKTNKTLQKLWILKRPSAAIAQKDQRITRSDDRLKCTLCPLRISTRWHSPVYRRRSGELAFRHRSPGNIIRKTDMHSLIWQR